MNLSRTIRQALIIGLTLQCGIVQGQKVIDTIAEKSCYCFERVLERSKLPEEDSLTSCITISMIPHSESLSKHKKLNPATVEGIREIHTRVRKSLKKKCRVFNG